MKVKNMEQKKLPTEAMLKAEAELDKIPKEQREKLLRASLGRKQKLFGETIDIQKKSAK